MTLHAHPASPSPSAVAPRVGSVGLIRRLAWLLFSGTGMVLWLQYPSDLWLLGMMLLGVSGPLLFPPGSHNQSISPRAAVISIGALLLIVFSPIAAYYIFGWSLREHPRAVLGIKIAFVLVWLAGAVHQLRLAFASRRDSPAA